MYKLITHSLVLVAVLLQACDQSRDKDIPRLDDSGEFVARALSLSLQEDTQVRDSLATLTNGVLDPPPSETDDDVRWVIDQLPAYGAVRISRDGQFVYEPEPDYFGADSFSYHAVRDTVRTPSAAVDIEVSGVADAPVVSGAPDTVIDQGRLYRARFSASDADGDSVRFHGSGLPGWLSLDPIDGLLSGTPGQQDIGLHENLRIGATDDTGLSSDFGPFSIEVLDINDRPTLNTSQFPREMDSGETVQVRLFPDDVDGDQVELSVEPNDFLSVEVNGGELTVTAADVPEVLQVNLVVLATDKLGKVTREVIGVSIHPVSESGRGRTILGREQGDGLHLVILGEGYKSDENNRFNDHVEALIGHMQRDPAIATHLSAWSIHTVFEASEDSGIDDNPDNDARSTIYNAHYFCQQVARLICADNIRIFESALSEYAWLDQVVVLVNDPRYGGKGGGVVLSSGFFPEVALHELGHSVAGLADEYVDSQIAHINPFYREGQYANVSQHDDPEQVPWSHWIDDPVNYPTIPGTSGVGIFEGGFYQASGIYRATSTSRMRAYDQLFGPVNGEQWALSVYRQVHPVLDFWPAVSTLRLSAGKSHQFGVQPVFNSRIQKINWKLDDERVAESDWQTELDIELADGQHELVLEISDISGRIRRAPPHAGMFSWTWNIVVE